ncbi:MULTISPECIES: DUF6194 family protein [Microbacterium]|uniref:DUF6194 family protein n=1 Tax=Microbacterium TaxID=33882 RepID=UPI001F106394|nr:MULTISPECIES: DUF6194 family protein [Microbacterium]
MEMKEIVHAVSGFEGVLVVIPEEGSGSPALAWGDAFFYYAPDGVMPERTQPYGTIVTKNYPDDEESRLDEPGRFRVNITSGATVHRRSWTRVRALRIPTCSFRTLCTGRPDGCQW